MKSVRELQREVEEFCKKNDWNTTIEYYVLDLVSEVGELAKELILASDYGLKEPEFSANTELELGDCLFSLMLVANELNIDLEKALEKAMAKYKERLSSETSVKKTQ